MTAKPHSHDHGHSHDHLHDHGHDHHHHPYPHADHPLGPESVRQRLVDAQKKGEGEKS